MVNIKPGSIIKGPNWPEPVEIKFVEETGEYIHIVGATTISGNHIDQLIPAAELLSYSVEEIKSYFSEEPWQLFLSLEAIRYRFASLYDPLLAMNISKIDPLPHQIEAVYGYVLKLPRIRFLIADDPGAGKTIMAGLIIKELKLRHLIKRILIISPGHLKDQWRRELSERFDERFIVIDRGILDSLYGENVWQRENQAIASIDFAKREEILPSLGSSHFDLTIVDEAHKMSAYMYGDKTTKTGRYKLGEILSRVSDNLLFLTATPHRGDPENYRLFLDLLEPGFFATNEMVQESIQNKDNPLFIRRIKEDLKDFEGRPLFLPRHVSTLYFELGTQSPNEKLLYNDLSRYVKTQYNLALTKGKKRNVAFALVILQRRLASSTYALLKSLGRRKKRLEDLLEGAEQREKRSWSGYDPEDIDDMSEEERWREEEIWETLSVSENREELSAEINTIEGLINQAKNIIQSEQEIKLSQLKDTMLDLGRQSSVTENRKILIFTESRDTLEYLEKKISGWGYRVNTIHGGMKLENRVKAESVFKNETEVLVATEAAGEGINLQFCHLMINYDIPWNPNRLEQRMGRIHRYGQQREVFIFNLVARDTREGMVLERLFNKLEEIKEALGTDKVFDILSEVLTNTNLSQILTEAAASARNMDEILKEIDIEVDQDYIAGIKENLGESLATHYIDYTRIKEMEQKARERRLIPEYTESFFKKAFLKAGGKTRETREGFLALDSVPYNIRNRSNQDTVRSGSQLLKRYPKMTFDKEIAFKNSDIEFVSFGHPLFEAVMAWIEDSFSESIQKGAVFTDPDGKLDGYILFYEGEIKDGTGNTAGKRLFSIYTEDCEAHSISPSILWDLAESGREKSGSPDDEIDIDSIKKTASAFVIKLLEKYREELIKERNRQAEIKKKYGIRSLEYMIINLDGDLISLYERKERGENVDLAIRNKEERKLEYENSLKELKGLLERERNLTMSMPRFRAIIRVRMDSQGQFSMHEDAEVERIGMETAIKYEMEHGRLPEDVSAEDLGFDIRSKDKKGNIRYIEVKARAREGFVSLTPNEWFKAKRFKEEYFLYSVMNARAAPVLYITQDPVNTLDADQKSEVVRYIIPLEEIKSKGETAN
ncbi:RNA polymerase-associated protein RapA [subsurface metagenome]